MKTNFSNIYNYFKQIISNPSDSQNLIKVKSLIFTNKLSEPVSLTVVLFTKENSTYLVKEIYLGANKNLNLFLSKDINLLLQEGCSIYAKADKNNSTSENLVDAFCSYEEIGLDQVSYQSIYFNKFLEIKTINSSSSSELFSVFVNDPQLYQQIEIQSLNQKQNLPRCYNFSNNDPCPEGYSFTGFVQDCEVGPCDKICCADIDPNTPYVLCGKVYQGVKQYNTPWNFYIDPKSTYVVKDNESLLKIMPSEINSTIGTSLAEGSECCFYLKGMTKEMTIEGPDHCETPLYLDAVKVFDQNLGEFIQSTSCQGDCKNISGSYCLDAEFQDFSNQISNLLAEAEAVVDEMSYEEIETDFFDNLHESLSELEGDLDYVPSLEELDQMLIESLYQSSSSSSEYFPPISFDYEINPISTNSNQPFEFALEEGSNLFFSKTGGSYSETYYKFIFSADKELSEIKAIVWGSDTGSAQISLKHSDGSNLAETQFGANINAGLFLSDLPLQEGEYLMNISSTEYSEIEYVLIFVIQQKEVE